MIDLSDGLPRTSATSSRETPDSGPSSTPGAIPTHADAEAMGLRDGVPALEHALDDGEDFELARRLRRGRRRASGCLPARLDRVGEVIDSPPDRCCLHHEGSASSSAADSPLPVRLRRPRAWKLPDRRTGWPSQPPRRRTTRAGPSPRGPGRAGRSRSAWSAAAAGRPAVRVIARVPRRSQSAISSPTSRADPGDTRAASPVITSTPIAYRTPSAFEDLGVADYWDTGCLAVRVGRPRPFLLPEDCWMISLEPTWLRQRARPASNRRPRPDRSSTASPNDLNSSTGIATWHARLRHDRAVDPATVVPRFSAIPQGRPSNRLRPREPHADRCLDPSRSARISPSYPDPNTPRFSPS